MKLLSNLTQTTRQLALGLLAIMPLMTTMPADASEQNRVEFSQAELDQMLAPIALYPDTILSQVLIASTYPLEIIQADRWARSNTDLKGEDAVKFADKKDWDPSVKALVAFPDILKKMSDDIDWTQRLGDAFLGSEEDVMDTVQRLRKRAYATGNLEKAEHIRVEQDNNTIVIEPAEERVVYVPVYDTRVVYGNWWWPDYPPVYWHYPSSYTYVSGFYWGASIYVGPSYYYSACHWHDRRVVVIDRDERYYHEPHFYTGRSIIAYQGAREWHHDPMHRRGVAYYNDSLRDNYGSRHESYEQDRNYRDNYSQTHKQNRFDDNHPQDIPHTNTSHNNGIGFGNENRTNLPIDRAEQLRERMNRIPDANNAVDTKSTDNNSHYENDRRENLTRLEGTVPRTQIDSHFSNRGGVEVNQPATNTNPIAQPTANPAQPDRNDGNALDRRMNRNVENAQPRPVFDRTDARQNVDHNNQNTESNNRPVRIDDSFNRRIESRAEIRPERTTENNRIFREQKKKDDDDKR